MRSTSTARGRGPTLREEIRQTRPFRSPSQEAAVAVLRTADEVRRHFARVVEPSGVTLQQYNVLRILRGAGPEGLPTLEVADRLLERTPGATRLISRLETKGLVLRTRSPDDRRRVVCTITGAGLELLEALDEPVDRADEAAMAALGEDEIRVLLALLGRVRHTLQDR